jgi:hypothetical protein
VRRGRDVVLGESISAETGVNQRPAPPTPKVTIGRLPNDSSELCYIWAWSERTATMRGIRSTAPPQSTLGLLSLSNCSVFALGRIEDQAGAAAMAMNVMRVEIVALDCAFRSGVIVRPRFHETLLVVFDPAFGVDERDHRDCHRGSWG